MEWPLNEKNKHEKSYSHSYWAIIGSVLRARRINPFKRWKTITFMLKWELNNGWRTYAWTISQKKHLMNIRWHLQKNRKFRSLHASLV